MARKTKKALVLDNFYEAYEAAKGPYSTVTARQIYYKVREILNVEHGVDLDEAKKGYYSRFTQEILTEMFNRDPALEATIVLEQRGDFFNPFFNNEIQLDTLSVRDLVDKSYSNSIYNEMRTIYGIPPELQYNKVLFVEKRGFNTMLSESGTLDRYNMGVVATQGYAPRAAKKIMQHLIDCGISVYILHDCDLFGYNIHERIAEGSDTYPMPLQVTDIGLKVEDVKDKLPERTLLNRDFSETLAQFTPSESLFFMPYPNQRMPPYTYQRVELNALTNEELLALIDRNIPADPLRPSDDILDGYVTRAINDVDDDDVFKDALARAVKNVYPQLRGVIDEYDKKDGAPTVREELDDLMIDGEHWATGLATAVARYRNKRAALHAKTMAKMLREAK